MISTSQEIPLCPPFSKGDVRRGWCKDLMVFLPNRRNDMPEALAMSEIIIYEDADGQSAVQVRLDGEKAWLTQKQMSELFETTPENITMHLKRIFADAELHEK